MIRSLLIIDEHSKLSPKTLSHLKKHSKIFVVYLSHDQQKLQFLQKQQGLKGRLQILDFLSLRQRHSLQHKKSFLKYIKNFSRQYSTNANHPEQLFYHSKWKASFWNLSMIHEQNPLKSNFYHTVIDMLTIQKISTKYQINNFKVLISNKTLAFLIKENFCSQTSLWKKWLWTSSQVIKSLAYAGLAYTNVWTKYLLVKILHKKQATNIHPYLLITDYPELQTQTKQSTFVCPIYGQLQEQLDKQHKKYSWLFYQNSQNYFGFAKNIRKLSSFKKSQNLFSLLEENLNLRMISQVSITYLKNLVYLLIFFKTQKNTKNHYKKLDITTLVNKNLWYSFAAHEALYNILNLHLFHDFFRKMPQSRNIFYLSEKNITEKILLLALQNTRQQHQTFAIQHTAFASLMLNYQLSDQWDNLPKPNYNLCYGKHSKLIFDHNASQSSPINYLWRAIRFPKIIQSTPSPKKHSPTVLIATSGRVKEALELLQVSLHCLNDLPIKVLLKTHPNTTNLVQQKTLKAQNNNTILSTQALTELIPQVDAIISTGSSIVYQAIHLYRPIIIPALYSNLNMDPLFGFSKEAHENIYFPNSSTELKLTLNKILLNKLDIHKKSYDNILIQAVETQADLWIP